MPQDNDYISKVLSSAKSALAGARKFTASVGDSEPSKLSAKPAAAAPAPAKPAPKADGGGLMKEADDVAQGIKARGEQVKVLGSMKKGGKIAKTGVYRMHKGEEVVKSDKSNLQEVMDRATKGLAGNKSKLHMSIEPTDDGRFVVDHEHRGGSDPMPSRQRHAPADLKELVEHIKSH